MSLTVFAGASGIAVDVRRPKPLIPLRTALDNVSSSSKTSLFQSPAVLMLTRMARPRNGERMTSITTDARVIVLLAFIEVCLLDQDAMRVASRRGSGLQPVCQWSNSGFMGFSGPICRLRLTNSRGPGE